jgi:hypothetical protein
LIRAHRPGGSFIHARDNIARDRRNARELPPAMLLLILLLLLLLLLLLVLLLLLLWSIVVAVVVDERESGLHESPRLPQNLREKIIITVRIIIIDSSG